MSAFLIVTLTALSSVYLLKIQREILPQYYFYYGQMLERPEDDISLIGMIFRTGIPLLAGLIAGSLAILFGCPASPEAYGLYVGLAITFLIIWPSIYYPASVLAYVDKKKKLYLLRIMFIALFALLGLLGGKLAVVFFQFLEWSTHKQLYAWIDSKAIVNNLISSVIYGAVIALLLYLDRKYLRPVSVKP
jgi:hypothetical protein